MALSLSLSLFWILWLAGRISLFIFCFCLFVCCCCCCYYFFFCLFWIWPYLIGQCVGVGWSDWLSEYILLLPFFFFFFLSFWIWPYFICLCWLMCWWNIDCLLVWCVLFIVIVKFSDCRLLWFGASGICLSVEWEGVDGLMGWGRINNN